MRKLETEDRAQILSSLVEGNSIASTVRMFGVSKITILRLLADAGTLAQQYHDLTVCNLQSKRLQFDEIWSFCYAKQKNVPEQLHGQEGFGDTWCWTSIDADSKLIVSWLVGPRDAGTANAIANDVAWRIDTRVQVTTDGLHAYWDAICNAFNCEVDFAQLIKIYANEGGGGSGKYSPAVCIGIEVKERVGAPDPKHISTSFIERSNLTMRMGMRRFTRLTNGFSKKLENHKHAIALHHFHYNFIRKHQTIKTTPAVMAGVADHEWTMLDFVKLMEREERLLGRRLSDYKPAKKYA